MAGGMERPMTTTDWAELWRELASRDIQASDEGAAQMVERWRGVARKLDSGEKQDPDPLLDHVLGRVTAEMTVLDVGAGIGRWTLPMARRVRRVTAVEPLQGMRQVLLEACDGAGNRQPGRPGHPVAHGPGAAPRRGRGRPRHLHDHGPARLCPQDGDERPSELLSRAPVPRARRNHRGVVPSASTGAGTIAPTSSWGIICCSRAGFHPNVLMEPTAVRRWTDPTLEAAAARAKRHLHVDDDRHDAMIREVLHRRLVCADGIYRWPDGMRSALIWWDR